MLLSRLRDDSVTGQELMQLSIQGKQLDIGDALRGHVHDAMERTLHKYFGDAVEVTVTMAREGNHLYRTNITAHVGRGINMEAQGEAGDAYASFDVTSERLSKRLRRHKRRLREHHGREQAEALPAQQYILSGEFGDEEEIDSTGDESEAQPVVVAEMATEINSLTVSEAVMRMDLAEMPALMFRNSAHGGLNMIYRRQDGNIGWIDPHGNAQD